MPIPAAAYPVIAAGLSAAGQVAGAVAQGSINKKTRKWNEKMYRLQRADALADWQMQADYNSPINQMARFRAAGLNPNLIYGQMSDMPAVRSSDSGSWNPKAPEFDAGSVLGTYQAVRMQNAQLDMLSTQKALAEAEIAVKRQQELNIAAGTVGKTIGNEWASSTIKDRIALTAADLSFRKGSIEQQAAQTEKIRQDTKFTIDQNARAQAMQAGNLAEQAARIAESWSRQAYQNKQTKWYDQTQQLQNSRTIHELATMRKNIENLDREGKLKEFEIALNQSGFTKHDEWYWRQLSSMLNRLSGTNDPEQTKVIINQMIENIRKDSGSKWTPKF